MPADFTCPICRELCVKPAALPCGHVCCLYCTHCAMGALGGSQCPCCRRAYAALPALSHALANHIAWIDTSAFGARLRELCKDERERNAKSPRFEIVSANEREKELSGAGTSASANAPTTPTSLARLRQGEFSRSRVFMEDDSDDIAVGEAFVKYGAEAARADARGTPAAEFVGVAAFHCCGCDGAEFAREKHPKYKCGEIASAPVACQQCGTVYDAAHAKILLKRAKGDEWCKCGSHREPTDVILCLKEDIAGCYPAEVLEQSRKRCDDALAANIVALKLEKSLQQGSGISQATETLVDVAGNRNSSSDEGSGERDNRGSDDAPTGATVSTGATTVTIDFVNFLHYGVGCDLCGEYPIKGRRFQCVECAASEFMGFDLCGTCMETVEKSDRKREYRFAQNHTDEHTMRSVRPRPTMVHVMQALHPELSPAQILNWLERQHAASAEAEAEMRAREALQTGEAINERQTNNEASSSSSDSEFSDGYALEHEIDDDDDDDDDEDEHDFDLSPHDDHR